MLLLLKVWNYNKGTAVLLLLKLVVFNLFHAIIIKEQQCCSHQSY